MQESDARLDHLSMRDLRLLAALIETRSVTRTAERLGLSQPAASRALDKVRRLLGDPIVVRSGAGATLTPRGQAAADRLSTTFAAIGNLFEPDHFDPATARAVVHIAATDYGATVVLGPLAAHLSTVAPGLILEARTFDSATFDSLASGLVDFALYADGDTPPEVATVDLFRETYACLVRPNHPVLSDGYTSEDLFSRLAAAPRAIMLFPDGRRQLPDDVLTDIFGCPAQPAQFRTPYFFSAPAAIAASDLVMCLPTRAASILARIHNLRVVPMPAQTGFTYRLVWHDRAEHSHQHRWLRETITAVSRLL